MLVIYAGGCASLIQLRRQRSLQAAALWIPLGQVFAVAGIIICIAVLSRLQLREALLMGFTVLIGAANWWWAKRRETQTQKVAEVVAATSVAD